MGFKCAPQITGLVHQDYPSGRHRSNGKAIGLEMGKERITASDTFDRTRSWYNEYDGYESGLDAWLSIENEAKDYTTTFTDKNGVEHTRKLKNDAVIGFALIINPPSDVCKDWTDEQYTKFYSDSFNALRKIEPRLFRNDNIVMMAEHYDEGLDTDTSAVHMPNDRHKHIMGKCKDQNGKFCGNIIDSKLLININKSYPALMRAYGWDMDDLDTVDWKRYKTDDAYRSEVDRRPKSGKSVNQYHADQLKDNLQKSQELKAYMQQQVEQLRQKQIAMEQQQQLWDDEKNKWLDDKQKEYDEKFIAKKKEMRKNMNVLFRQMQSDYKNKKDADFQAHEDALDAQNKIKLDEALARQVSDVKAYRQFTRGRSSDITNQDTDAFENMITQ